MAHSSAAIPAASSPLHGAFAQARVEPDLVTRAWKHSGDPIVDRRGRVRVPPIAAAEIQGYVFLALRAARFRRAFYLPDERFYALGIDEQRCPIDSVTSNVVHCFACGILDPAHRDEVVARLLAPDMFSGWGVRALSSDNPAYDSFSYHRGSVWPLENATIAAGMRLYGYDEGCERILAAQLAAASVEVRGLRVGHARVDLAFHRDRRGRARWEVTRRDGPLLVFEQSTHGRFGSLRVFWRGEEEAS